VAADGTRNREPIREACSPECHSPDVWPQENSSRDAAIELLCGLANLESMVTVGRRWKHPPPRKHAAMDRGRVIRMRIENSRVACAIWGCAVAITRHRSARSIPRCNTVTLEQAETGGRS